MMIFFIHHPAEDEEEEISLSLCIAAARCCHGRRWLWMIIII
jgi:hypothetical protein